MPIVNELLKKSAITIKEEIYEQYKPKLVKYVRLHPDYTSDDSLEKLLRRTIKSKKATRDCFNFFSIINLK